MDWVLAAVYVGSGGRFKGCRKAKNGERRLMDMGGRECVTRVSQFLKDSKLNLCCFPHHPKAVRKSVEVLTDMCTWTI